jgi:peptidoglycan/LPS O-acetylase OafA/YrhL
MAKWPLRFFKYYYSISFDCILRASAEIKKKRIPYLQILGDISYPIYITHYAFIYVYTGWVADTKIKISEAYPYSILTLVTSIVVAYASLRLYDVPVRSWLKKKILK